MQVSRKKIEGHFFGYLDGLTSGSLMAPFTSGGLLARATYLYENKTKTLSHHINYPNCGLAYDVDEQGTFQIRWTEMRALNSSS